MSCFLYMRPTLQALARGEAVEELAAVRAQGFVVMYIRCLGA